MLQLLVLLTGVSIFCMIVCTEKKFENADLVEDDNEPEEEQEEEQEEQEEDQNDAETIASRKRAFINIQCMLFMLKMWMGFLGFLYLVTLDISR